MGDGRRKRGGKTGRDKPPPPRFDLENLFGLYRRHRGNLHELLREERGPGIPRSRETLRRYERRLGWVERLAQLEAKTSRKIDDLVAQQDAAETVRMRRELKDGLARQIKRLTERLESQTFNPDTQASLLNAIVAALRQVVIWEGGVGDRVDVPGYTPVELEAAFRDPRGSAVGMYELRKAKYCDRIPDLDVQPDS